MLSIIKIKGIKDMTGKQRIINAINGRPSDIHPVTIHGWGLYKFGFYDKYSGIDDYSLQDDAWDICGNELANVEIRFHELFDCDWIHLSDGKWNDIKKRINDPANRELLKAVRCLESKSAIDEFIETIYLPEEELYASNKYDHIKILSEKYDAELFIQMNLAGPIFDIADHDGVLGFEECMIAMIEKEEMFQYLAHGMYTKQLDIVQVIKNLGAQGYLQTEGYIATDLISIDLYERTMHDILKEFYSKVNNIGIIPMCYFTGDCLGLIKKIRELDIKVLLVEESKKNFRLEPAEIIKEIGEDRAVVGNVDSVNVLLRGTEEEVRKYAAKQLLECKSDCFISGTGSPIPFGTPPDNINAFIDEIRNTF